MTLKNTNAELTLQSRQLIRGEEQLTITHENAKFDQKNDKKYIRYEERDETGFSENKVCLVISDDEVVVSRTGAINARLVYRENTKTESNYRVPYGILNVEVYTKKISQTERPNGLTLVMDYDLSVGGEKLSTVLTLELDIEKKE